MKKKIEIQIKFFIASSTGCYNDCFCRWYLWRTIRNLLRQTNAMFKVYYTKCESTGTQVITRKNHWMCQSDRSSCWSREGYYFNFSFSFLERNLLFILFNFNSLLPMLAKLWICYWKRIQKVIFRMMIRKIIISFLLGLEFVKYLVRWHNSTRF